MNIDSVSNLEGFKIDEFKIWLENHGIGEMTINTYISGVKKYLHFVEGHEIITPWHRAAARAALKNALLEPEC